MFYLDPFALVALVALARGGIVSRRGRAAIAAAALAGVLPFFIPFTSFINTSALSDTFEMLPWWWVQDHWITIQQVRWAAGGVSLVAAAVFLLTPRRAALALVALVGVYFVATAAVVANGRHGIDQAASGDLFIGTKGETYPDWIDRAVGREASVAVLWSNTASDYTVWENEFFNRSVGTVYDLDHAFEPDPLPETAVDRSKSGLLLSGGRPVRAAYVLADSENLLAAHPVAEDSELGLTLYRVDGPVVMLRPPEITGVYPNSNGWSGPVVTYTLTGCTGGSLAVTLESDASLFPKAQTVVARESGRVVAEKTVAPTGPAVLTVPLRRAGGRCAVTFTIPHTAIPERVESGSTDTRRLGLLFLEFVPAP
jgi:hypothetical protein